MKNIIGFFIMLISGSLFGIIAKNNLWAGVLLLVVGISYLIWSFFKKRGWFYKGGITKLIIFSFAKLIGFNLFFFNILKISEIGDRHKTSILLIIIFVYALVVGFYEAFKLFKK